VANSIGSLEWARAGGGRLGGRDRARLFGQAVRLQLLTIPERLRAALRLTPRSLAALDEREFRLPDSAASRDAEARLAELGESELVNHSYRTFAWATALSGLDGLRHDEEVLYVASLLHDVGLAPELGGGRERPKPCFTLVGAAHAEQVGEGNGWSAARAQTAADAITMHLNLWVSPEQGAEAHLVHAGAYLDVLGARYFRVAPQTRDWVLDRYPRRGTKRALIELFGAEAAASPGTRSAFYRRPLMSGVFMRLAPFDE
jgi:hypothetical protein